ncbi:MAG: hypothetical protein ACOVOR_03595 [Rhabdochlamydiaceae bacterium]
MGTFISLTLSKVIDWRQFIAYSASVAGVGLASVFIYKSLICLGKKAHNPKLIYKQLIFDID